MLIKKKSLVVALISSFIICGVLVLTLVGNLFYLELKDKELTNTYTRLLHTVNARIYGRHIDVFQLIATIEKEGALKGKPVIEGAITNKGKKAITDIVMKARFLDEGGAVLYEVTFRPQEPPLGSSSLTQTTFPYLSSPAKAVIKPGETLAFKKILSHCPDEILAELKRQAVSGKTGGKWPGRLSAEMSSVAF